jgi:hypothetical protein
MGDPLTSDALRLTSMKIWDSLPKKQYLSLAPWAWVGERGPSWAFSLCCRGGARSCRESS